MKITRKYERYWKNKQDSNHSIIHSINFYRLAAREILVFHNPESHKRILEIGCGAGECFPYYEFDRNYYLGIDFSKSMLNEFKKRNPGYKVIYGRGDSFYTPKKFDFIFSNNVIQYFTPGMTEDHIKNMSKMLSSNGRLIIGGIPNIELRNKYERGVFCANKLKLYSYLCKKSKKLLNTIRNQHDFSIGHWYRINDFKEWGKLHDLRMNFFGCLIYPYRFHIIYTWGKISQSPVINDNEK